MARVGLVLQESRVSKRKLRQRWLTYLEQFDTLTKEEREDLAKSNAKSGLEILTVAD